MTLSTQTALPRRSTYYLQDPIETREFKLGPPLSNVFVTCRMSKADSYRGYSPLPVGTKLYVCPTVTLKYFAYKIEVQCDGRPSLTALPNVQSTDSVNAVRQLTDLNLIVLSLGCGRGLLPGSMPSPSLQPDLSPTNNCGRG